MSRVGKVLNRTSEREYPYLVSYFREKVLNLCYNVTYRFFLMGFHCQVEEASSISNMLVVFIMIVCRILLGGFSYLLR